LEGFGDFGAQLIFTYSLNGANLLEQRGFSGGTNHVVNGFSL
jgi:hypothetical protein